MRVGIAGRDQPSKHHRYLCQISTEIDLRELLGTRENSRKIKRGAEAPLLKTTDYFI
jgi:hypothetical protein